MPAGLKKAYAEQGTIPPLSKLGDITSQTAPPPSYVSGIQGTTPTSPMPAPRVVQGVRGSGKKPKVVSGVTGKPLKIPSQKVPPGTPSKSFETLTPVQYKGELAKQEKTRQTYLYQSALYNRQLKQQYTDISRTDPATTQYNIPSQEHPVSKTVALKFIKDQMTSQSSYRKGLRDIGDIRKTVDVGEWDPSTKIIKETTAEGVGYGVKFPYEGAEFYADYKSVKDDPTVGLGGFFSPTDPLGLATSFYSLTGQKKLAEQKRIGSYGYWRGSQEAWKGKKGWEHFGSYIISAPIVQLGTLPAMTMTGGVGYSAIAGRLAFKTVTIGGKTIAAASLFKAGATVAGAALITPPVIDIGKEFKSGRTGEAFAKSYMLGASMAVGIKSFRMGQQLRAPSGLTFYEKGALKGFEKHVRGLDPKVPIPYDGEMVYPTSYAKGQWIQTSKSLAKQIGFLRKQSSNVFDVKYRVGEAFTLQDKPLALEFIRESGPFFKHGLIEKGSTVSPPSVVPVVKDVDFMAGAKAAATLSYFWKSRYPGAKYPWDIHQHIPVGEPTGSGRLGGVRMPEVVGPTGGFQISRVEWLDRLRVSSAELSHKGRMKDIERLPSVLTETYREMGFIKEGKAGKVTYDFPSKKLERAYKTSMKGLEFMKTTPLMMSTQLSAHYKSLSLSERFWRYKTGVYQKFPGLMEKRIKNIVDPTGTHKMTHIKDSKQLTDFGEKASQELLQSSKIKPSTLDVFKPQSKQLIKTKNNGQSSYLSKSSQYIRNYIGTSPFSSFKPGYVSKSHQLKPSSFYSPASLSFPSLTSIKSPSGIKSPSFTLPSTSKPPSFFRSSSRYHPSYYPPLIPAGLVSGSPKPSMFGRGRRGFDFGFKQKGFKFRKADIGTPFSGFKGILKGVKI